MSEQNLHDILANSHRVNDIRNIGGGFTNVLRQEDAVKIAHQMARLQHALAGEVAALRADLTKLATHLLAQSDGQDD